MNKTSWMAACERAELAADARDQLQVHEANLNEDRIAVRRTWENFLSELSRSFNCIFHGERSGSPEQPIIKRIRDDRRVDEVLVYLRECRNAAEHGVEWTTSVGGEARPVGAAEQASLPFQVIMHIVDNEGNEHILDSAKSPLLKINEMGPVLVPVKRQHLDIPVPSTHLNQAISVRSPSEIAGLGLQYLRARLAELEPFIDAH